MPQLRLLLLGDSDIAFWPKHLLPSCDGGVEVSVEGYSGATLDQVVDKYINISGNIRQDIIACCAGENDMGNGVSVCGSLQAMDRLLDAVGQNVPLIFLGPKFEPWLADDAVSRKHYVKLSKGFSRRCQSRPNTEFINCLTMFCGDSANVSGAVLGGRAKPDTKYFSHDLLHLNEEGYQIWKGIVEQVLAELTQKLHD